MLEALRSAVQQSPPALVWGASLTLAYLLGSIPFGYLVARVNQVDITTVGSGNPGGTNVMRACGKPAGLLVYLLDFLKAFLPILALRALHPEAWMLHIAIGLLVIVGHSKPVFFGFKGGKSAISSLGAIVALEPMAGLVCAVMAASLIFITRVVSIASLSTGAVAWLIMWAFGAPLPYVICGAVAGAYVFIRHKDNIKRLINGTENKI